MNVSNSDTEYTYVDDMKLNQKIQKWLNMYALCSLKVDGIIGPKTKKGLIRALQHYLNTEHSANIEVDGVFGCETKKACSGITIKPQDMGNAICILQGLMYANRINPNGFNGIYNNNFIDAIKHIQSTIGVSMDGICRSNILILLASFK